MEIGVYFAGKEFAQYRDLARAAEALGFSSIMLPDHIVYEGVEGEYDPRFLAYDWMMVAAVIAEATKKIQVGHLVLCNLFRHPAIAAQSLTSLDHLSNGRAIVGLGTGWTKSEFDMTGIPFPEIGERLGMLDESLTCMRSLWTNERTTFKGKYYNFNEAILWPKPVRKPHPPIVVGGGGKGTMRIAAKHADYVNIIVEVGAQGQVKTSEIGRFTEDRFKERVKFVREEAVRYGRNPRSIKISATCFIAVLADSRAKEEAAVKEMATVFHSTPDAVRRGLMSLVGNAEEWVNELKRREKELEIEQMIIPVEDEATLRLIGEQVLPRFKD